MSVSQLDLETQKFTSNAFLLSRNLNLKNVKSELTMGLLKGTVHLKIK